MDTLEKDHADCCLSGTSEVDYRDGCCKDTLEGDQGDACFTDTLEGDGGDGCFIVTLEGDDVDGCFPCKKILGMKPNFKPKDPVVVEYCEKLIHCKFYGETSNLKDGRTDHSEDEHVINMASVLRALDSNLRHHGEQVTGKEPDIVENLTFAAQKRAANEVEIAEKLKRLSKDMGQFVEIYKKRGVPSQQLHHKSYWGTRQQLLAGKVIADWVDAENGPLDPMFGALLCPPAGRTGAGDSTVVHKMLFDENGPIAFHSAVHDAFGYLINFHNTGPGYDYLGAQSFFEKHKCLSGQAAGLLFWKKFLDEKHRNQIADVLV